jgi:hypothetical protein
VERLLMHSGTNAATRDTLRATWNADMTRCTWTPSAETNSHLPLRVQPIQVLVPLGAPMWPGCLP